MNRLLIYIMVLLFLSGATALAIEKEETKQATQQNVEKKDINKQDKATQSESNKSQNQDQQKRENTDYFIDSNNNGINDRVEKREKKTTVDKEPEKKEVKVKKTRSDSK